MKMTFATIRTFLVSLAACLALASHALADDIRVISSGGFAPALQALTPAFERATGHHLITQWGPSMGDTVNAIPKRLQRGEPIDVVVMVGTALDELVKQGKVAADSKALLARSRIAAAVRSGTPKPDIHTVDALKAALLGARSIAYSDSASGVYLSQILFPKLGIASQITDKAHMIPAEPVGQVLVRGEAELGFQQVSELRAVPGVDIIGVLPDEVNQITLYSAAVVNGARSAEAGRAFIRFLASPAAAETINRTGLEAACGSSN
jgi:molybdate transport system substrate-binding protein